MPSRSAHRLDRARMALVPAARKARRKRHGGDPTREALHRLCRDEGLPTDPKALYAIGRSKVLQPDVTMWTYVVGLAVRAEGRGEGKSDWELWRSIDRDARKQLDVDVIWAARERVLAALRPRTPAST